MPTTTALRSAPTAHRAAAAGGAGVRLAPAPLARYLGLVLLFVLVAALVFQSNAAWLMAYIILGAAAVSVLHARRNLLRISVVEVRPEPVYAGDPVPCTVVLATPRPCWNLRILPGRAAIDPDDRPAELATLPAGGATAVTAILPPAPRGRLRVSGVAVESAYPLGLSLAQRSLPATGEGVIYPRPAGFPLDGAPRAGGQTGGGGEKEGGDDFTGHRRWQPGDSQRRIDWRASARGRGLLLKIFAGHGSGDLALDWDDAPGDEETRLEQLALWVEEASAAGLRWSLRIPTARIPPGAGDAHRHHCLRALGLFPERP